VTVKGGKLYDASGNLLDTSRANSLHAGPGVAVYVMDKDGKMYVSNRHAKDFKHSSFLSGQPVAAAGEVEVKQGEVKYISRASGHYKPEEEHHDQFVNELNSQGVDTSNTTMEGGF